MNLIPILIQLLLPVAAAGVKEKLGIGATQGEVAKATVKAAVVGNVKSVTFWTAAVLAVLGWIESNQALVSTLILEYFPTFNMGTMMMYISALIVFLRSITDNGLADKVDIAPKE